MKYWKKLGQSLAGVTEGASLGVGLAMNSTGDIIACGQGFSYDNPIKIFKFNIFTSKWEQLGNSISPLITDNENYTGNGWYVDLSDDGYTLVTNTDNSYIQVYKYNGKDWVQKGFNIHAEPNVYWLTGISISSDGNTIALGNSFGSNNDTNPNTDPNPYTGSLRIFKYKEYTQSDKDSGKYHHTSYEINNAGGNTNQLIMTENTDTEPVVGEEYWTQLGTDLDGKSSWSYFGYRVTLSKDGTTVAVGSRSADKNEMIPNSMEGNTEVFEYNENNDEWVKKGSTIWGEKPYDRGGVGVALSRDGNVLAISHPIYEYLSDRKGYVKVFYFNVARNDWVQLGETIDESSKKDNNYGWNIDLSDDGLTLSVGAYTFETQDLDNQVDMGKVYEPVQVFEFNTSTHQWEQKGQDIRGPLLQYGHNVKMNSIGSRIAIGSFGQNLTEVYEYVDDPTFEFKMKAVLARYPATNLKIKKNMIEYVLRMWDMMNLK